MTPAREAALVAPPTYRDELIDHGLLIPCGVRGVYGKSAELEDTIDRVDRLVTDSAREDGAEVMRFPPLISRADFEKSEYLKSFPHLAGSIHSFTGDERAHRRLLQAAEAGGDWSADLSPAEVVLAPAACYPVYPAIAGTLPPAGRLIDVASYCFRHEPSDDAGRLQIFRMREHVRATDAAGAMGWRTMWMDRAQVIASRLGLDARTEIASDPFFGRGGAMMAEGQREQLLKFEITAPIARADHPTAIISLNYHQDHFGSLFGLRTAEGGLAHTACVGFGLERIAFAMYRAHGFGRAHWPQWVREALGL